MKLRALLSLGLVLLLPVLASCQSPPDATPTAPPAPTAVPLPPSYALLESYMKAWEAGRYAEMYDLLSKGAQAAIARDKFVQRYSAIAEGSTITSVKTSYTKDGALARAQGAVDLPFTVLLSTARVGEIREENVLPLVEEEGRWRVNWSPSLIFKDLTSENRILFEPRDPKRGSILDRKGRPLATTGTVVSVGVQPGAMEDEAALLAALQRELKVSPDLAKQAYQGAQPDWFVPLRDLSNAQASAIRPRLASIPGVIFREKPARVYPEGSLAVHAVGYVSKVTPDELKKMASKGYTEDDLVGRAGVEASSDDILAGERGGRLSVVTSQGERVRVIAEKPARDGQDVQLSLDLDLQKLAEGALGDQAGSVVVLDVPGNTVLAMASYPRFDPNQFITGFSDAEWKRLNDDPLRPFQDRPAASAYPTGSVFKVVTMAAGMDKAGFTKDSEFDCKGSWDGLGNGQILGDWLPGGHGRLNLFEGLMESCNIVFYELGKKLDSMDPNLLPALARGFGFGQPTGVSGLQEVPGVVPDPAWKQKNRNESWFLGDSVNLAIGQGFFLATPIQVANAYAAIARGGALMSPGLVGKQTPQGLQYQTQQKGTLPVQPATLETIRQAMRGVTSDPRGTAYYAFQGSRLSVAAKTGSAEAEGPDSHAWFAAYAPAETPQIAMVVMVESKGHGAEVAAPVARKILDGYFR